MRPLRAADEVLPDEALDVSRPLPVRDPAGEGVAAEEETCFHDERLGKLNFNPLFGFGIFTHGCFYGLLRPPG